MKKMLSLILVIVMGIVQTIPVTLAESESYGGMATLAETNTQEEIKESTPVNEVVSFSGSVENKGETLSGSSESILPLVENVVNNIVEKKKNDIDDENVVKVLGNLFDSGDQKDTVSVREVEGNTTMIDTEANLGKIKNQNLVNLLSKKAKVGSVVTDIGNEFTSGISFTSNGTKISIKPLFGYESDIEKTTDNETVKYESTDFSTVMKYDADKNALKEAIVIGADSKYVKDGNIRLDWKVSFDKRLMFKPTPTGDYKIYELSGNGDYIATLPKMFYIDKEGKSHYENVKTEIKLDNASDGAFVTLKIDSIDQNQFPIVIDPSVESENNNETLTQTGSNQNYDSSNFFLDTIGKDNPNFNGQMLSDLSKLKLSSKIAADKFYTKSSSGSISTKLSTTENLYKEISVNKTIDYVINGSNLYESNHIKKSKNINRTVRFELLDKKFENTDYSNSFGDSKIYFNDNDIISYNQGNVDSKAVLKEWIYAMSKNSDIGSTYEWKVSGIGSSFEFENLLDGSLSIKSDIGETDKYEILRLEPIYYYDNKGVKKGAKYEYNNETQTIKISVAENELNYPLMIDPTIIGSAYFDLTGSGSGSSFYSPTYMVHKAGRFFIADGNLMDIKVYDDSYNFVGQLGSRSNGLSTTQDKLSGSGASFWLPGSIDVDSSGNIYVVDVNGRKVKKYDSNFNYVWTLGSSYGDNDLSGEQALLSPGQGGYGIAIDSLGYIYVQSNWKIKKYDSNANFVATILGGVQGDNTLNGTSAQYNWLSQIAFDSADNLYLVDGNSYKIKKYTKTGTYISTLGSGVNAASNNLSGTAAIIGPYRITFDSTNQLYIYNSYGCAIKKYDTSFNWISNLGGGANCGYNQLNGESAQLSNSVGLYVSGSGDIYTMDSGYKLLRKYNSAYVWQGDVLGSTYTTYNELSGTSAKIYNISSKSSVDINNNIWISNGSYIKKYDSNGNQLLRIGDYLTSGSNQLSGTAALLYANNIATDGSGNVLVNSNYIIKKYSSTGSWIMDLGDPYTSADNNLSGTGARFKNIIGMYVDKIDNKIYVIDSSSYKVKVYDSNGNFVSVLGSGVWGDNTLGGTSAQFNQPYSFVKLANGNFLLASSTSKLTTYDSNFNYVGHVYPSWNAGYGGEMSMVIDSNGMLVSSAPKNNIIVVFDPITNTTVGTFGTGVAGDGESQFSNPTSVSLDTTGNILVMDSYNGKIKKILKDVTPPTASTGTINQNYVTLNPSDTSSIYKITYCIDAFNTCTPNLTLTGGVWDVNTVMYRGTQYIRYKVMDAWFNESGIYSQTFISDTTAPVAGLMYKETIGSVLVDNDLSGVNAMFRSVQDIAIDNNLNLYVSDYSNYRMKKYSSTGSFLFAIGNGNAGISNDGSLGNATITPYRSATDSLGNIYIAPINSDYKVKKYDSNGNFLFTIGDGTTGDNNLSGTAAKLKGVRYLAVNSLNQLLVLDGTSPSLIKIYDSNGNYVSRISYAVGSGTPIKIALDSSDNIYLHRNRAILKFNSAGTYIGTLGLDATTDASVNTLSGTGARMGTTTNFDVDESGNIYVARQTSNSFSKLTKYDTNFNYIGDLIGQDTIGDNELSGTSALVKFIHNVEVGSGRIYILDNTSLNIKYYYLNGNFIGRIGKNYYDNNLSGKENIGIKSISFIRKGFNNNWYIADGSSNAIKVYDSNWNFLFRIGHPSSLSGTGSYLNAPQGVVTDNSGNIYVSDYMNHAVKKFSSTGSLLAVLGTEGTMGNNNLSGTSALLQYPGNIEIDASGSIYVTSNTNVLKKYDSNFNYVRSSNKNASVIVFKNGYLYAGASGYTKLTKLDTDFNEISSFGGSTGAGPNAYSSKQSGNYAATSCIAVSGLSIDSYNNVYLQSNCSVTGLGMKFDTTGNFLMAWGYYNGPTSIGKAVTSLNYNADGPDAPTFSYPIYVDDLMNVYRTRGGGMNVYTQEGVRPTAYTNTGSTYIKTVADDAGGVKSTLISCDGTTYYEEYYQKSGKNIDVISQSTYASSLSSKGSSLWFGDIATDKIGKNVVASVFYDGVYISNDYGQTWRTKTIGSAEYGKVDMSSDGSIITTIANADKIYVSTDSGNTFVGKESNRAWNAIALNDTGKIQLAAVNGGFLYVSTDTGSTWTQTGVSSSWQSVDMSWDGVYMVAISSNGTYASYDSGLTWQQIRSDTFGKNIKISADGKVIGILVGSPTITLKISTNYGGSFTDVKSSTGLPYFSLSALGNEIIFSDNPGFLYKSYDYGSTWSASIGSSSNWNGTAQSYDGDRLYAIADKVYTAYNNSVKCSVGDGTKTIYAKFKDYGDNVSVVYSGTTILDTVAPVLTNVLPTGSGYLNTPELYYTLSENTASGTIIFTRTSGTADANSPHICQLQGTSLNSGAHNKLTLSADANICSSFDTLVDGAIYDITMSFTDFAGNVSLSTVKNNITYGNNRFWIGGSGNFSDTNHWSLTSGGVGGATVPTSALNVIFDNYSSTANAAYTVTMDAVGNVNDFVMNGPGGGNKVTIAGSQALNIYGSLSLLGGSAGITNSYTGTITFKSTTTGRTIYTNGLIIPYGITFNGIGGGWTLLDNLNGNGGMIPSVITLTAGSLDTNGKNVVCWKFVGTGSGVRSLTLGSSTITASSANASDTNWDFTTTTNLTFNAGTSTINVVNGLTTFAGGGLTYYNVSWSPGANTNSTYTISGNNTYNNLTLTGSAASNPVVLLGSNITVNGTVSFAGRNSALQRLFIKSNVTGTPRTIVANAVNASNVDFQDITGTGSASWDMSSATGGSGDAGGNTMKSLGTAAFTAPVTTNWISGATWSSATWSIRVPLPQDTATFTTAGVATITQDMPRIGSVDFSGSANKTWTTSTTTSVFGSINLTNLATLTSNTQVYTFEGRGNNTLTSAGKVWSNGFTVNTISGSLSFADNFTTSAVFSFDSGILNGNNFDIKINAINIVTTNTKTLNLGNGTWEITGNSGWQITNSTNLTLNAGLSTIKLTGNSTSIKYFVGAGFVYYNVWYATLGTGVGQVSGSNKFNDFKIDAGRTVKFTAGTTTTVNTFTASGTSGNLITIDSSNTSTFTLTKSGSSVVDSDYLNIQHSIATPANKWYAGLNSVNNQAVASAGNGWIFNMPNYPSTVTALNSPTDNVLVSSRQFSATCTDPNVGDTLTGHFVIGGVDYAETSTPGVTPHTFTYTHTADLNSVSWYAYCSDGVVNSSNSATRTAKIDATGPIGSTVSFTGITSTGITTIENTATDAGFGLHATWANFRINGSTTSGFVSGTTGYQFTGLSSNTAYSFDVQTKDSAGNLSAWTATVNKYTLSLVPGTLSGTGYSTTRIDLSFLSGSNNSNTQYAIALSNDNWVTTKYVQSNLSIGDPSYFNTCSGFGLGSNCGGTIRATGLTPNTTYKIKVKSRNGDNLESLYGNEISINTNEYLSFSVNSPSVNFANTTPGLPYIQSTTLNILTNVENGVQISVKRATVDATIGHSSDSDQNTFNTGVDIQDKTEFNGSNSALWSGNGLGFRINKTNTATNFYDSNTWGTDDTTNSKWSGIPFNYVNITTYNSFISTSSQIQIDYKMLLPSTQKTGSYQGDITVRAYVNL